ncbi:MAG: hypothetical protein ACT4OY_04455 [Alphaproteobacteria bacterium]
MEIPPTIAAKMAIARQNVGLAVIKHAAEGERAVADILAQALSVTPSGRGSQINFSV